MDNYAVSFRSSAIVAAIVLCAVIGGWVYGASGRSELEQARREAVERADINKARAAVLEGQLAVFQLNFGDAAKRFEAARSSIERVQHSLRETGQAERAGRLEIALTHLRDAQRLAIALDANARNAAGEALKTLASFGS